MGGQARLVRVLERVILISWLLKDFGWLTTNIYIAIPFGIISCVLHLILVALDPRHGYTPYNFSLLAWVLGNTFWMTSELLYDKQSSDVHVGPKTPIGDIAGLPEEEMNNVKTAMFCVGIGAQLGMYLLIFCGKLDMPQELDEDLDIRKANDLQVLCGDSSLPDNGLAPQRADLNAYGSRNGGSRDGTCCVTCCLKACCGCGGVPTVAYVENGYILFWILKDLFWAFGTGDEPAENASLQTIEFCETMAMLFGICALLIYVFTAYVVRRDVVHLVDSVTTLCWIIANFIWMCGEFFLRYRNGTLDDEDEGRDDSTRTASVFFFTVGLLLQTAVLYHLSGRKMCPTEESRSDFQIEMFGTHAGGGFAPVGSTDFSPQRFTIEDEEEEEIMF